MMSNIVGWLMVSGGFLFALSPERLRSRLRRKGARTVRRYLVAAGIGAGALVMSVARDFEGYLPAVFMGIGLIIIAKAVFLLKAKSAEMIAERIMNVPAIYLRLYAVAQVALGAGLLWLKQS